MSIRRGRSNGRKEEPYEIATAWVLREEAGRLSRTDRERLEHWLESDGRNREAWERALLALVAVNENAADPELIAMRGAALSARPEQRRRFFETFAAAAVAALVLGGVGWWTLQRLEMPSPVASRESAAASPSKADLYSATYSTSGDERSTITLPDGSVATLDTNSFLKVAYSNEERGVHLLQGAALFEVAKHKRLPFQVYAADRLITAIGTKFNVRLNGVGKSQSVSVALLEGVVKVSNLRRLAPADTPSVLTMVAGQVLESGQPPTAIIDSGRREALANWRASTITFEDTPLGQAVAEMNRYTKNTIMVADPRLAELRISGVFKTRDADHFAEKMAEVFPIVVDHNGQGSPVIRPRLPASPQLPPG